jgi:hypothetical protein
MADGVPGRPRGIAKTGGRQAGTPNKATREMRQWAQGMVRDPEFRKNFEERFRTCELSPGLIATVLAYAYGRPRMHLEVAHVDPEPIEVIELDAIEAHEA